MCKQIGALHDVACEPNRPRLVLCSVQTFGRGILCNWLVCLAVWQASAANTLGGKAIAVWFPISAFVAMGLEVSSCCSISVLEQQLSLAVRQLNHFRVGLAI